ncbi:MAG: hypothetical protein KAS17_07945 [Victivallaceae bacterium]|nr:hypothetical protein [Victivallaceae bacterium]
MNSKERFTAICNYQLPDRVAINYLAHPEADKMLRKRLGCNSEKELLDAIGSDFFFLSSRDISQNEGFMKCYKGPKLDIKEQERVCPLGIRWTRHVYDSKFAVDDAISGPLENATDEKDILKHRWPVKNDFDFSCLHQECEENSERVIISGLWSGIMGDSYRLLGFENYLLKCALEPQFIKTLINRMIDIYLELNDALFSELKGKTDIWFFGNDFGSQNGLLLSPDMWYELFFENIKRLTSLAHGYGLKVMMHSCGAISEIIPYLIEAGVDILDPVQTTATGMNPQSLTDNFGGKIIFHGGVDTQQILRNGSIKEITEHVQNLVNTFGKSGGYIFAPCNSIGPDIPVENVVAMYKAAKLKIVYSVNKEDIECGIKSIRRRYSR